MYPMVRLSLGSIRLDLDYSRLGLLFEIKKKRKLEPNFKIIGYTLTLRWSFLFIFLLLFFFINNLSFY